LFGGVNQHLESLTQSNCQLKNIRRRDQSCKNRFIQNRYQVHMILQHCFNYIGYRFSRRNGFGLSSDNLRKQLASGPWIDFGRVGFFCPGRTLPKHVPFRNNPDELRGALIPVGIINDRYMSYLVSLHEPAKSPHRMIQSQRFHFGSHYVARGSHRHQ